MNMEVDERHRKPPFKLGMMEMKRQEKLLAANKKQRWIKRTKNHTAHG
jgi:hypothetical protein